jgi:hypothetical protein
MIHWQKAMRKLEYYENAVLQEMTMLDERFFFQAALHFKPDFLTGCLIECAKGTFAAVWEAGDPTYILGSAFSFDQEIAWHKAYQEGMGKIEKVQKKLCLVSEIADCQLAKPIKPGQYKISNDIKLPHMLLRHHKILSDLNLFMYQSVP